MNSNYPAGVDGSNPYFNQLDADERCSECLYRISVQRGGEEVSLGCSLEYETEGVIELIDGDEPACLEFEYR